MSKDYTVTIYQSIAGRWCIRHPMSKNGVHYIHNKDFASFAYSKVFCKRQGWKFELGVGW